MKKLLTVASILIAASFAAPTISNANNEPGQRTPGIDRREARQSRRIRRGFRRGSLTRGEASRLAAQQARIRRHERRARADGLVTRRERMSIHRQENRASRNIYRRKHNNR